MTLWLAACVALLVFTVYVTANAAKQVEAKRDSKKQMKQNTLQ